MTSLDGILLCAGGAILLFQLGGMTRAMMRSHRQMRRYHEIHLTIMRHCERMRPLLMPQYLELKAQGECEMAEYRRRESARKREQMLEYAVQVTHQF